MESGGLSATLVAFYPTTRRHAPENYNLHIRCLIKLVKRQIHLFKETVTKIKASLITITIHNERKLNTEWPKNQLT
jgi:hypothetical protein